MISNIIAIVDKSYPPKHSFVDAMLAKALPDAGKKVLIITSKCEKNSHLKPRKYIKATVVATLLERKNIKRFINFFRLAYLLNVLHQKKRYKKNTLLFIRNEPIYLLVSYFYKNKFSKIIYQQSFPHENTNNIFKKYITLLIFKFFGQHVNKVLGVSELSINRLRKYFKPSIRIDYVPLCVSANDLRKEPINPIKNPLKFIYIGTFNQRRKLDVILTAISQIYMQTDSSFTFIGGTEDEISDLYHKFSDIINNNDKIKLLLKKDRDELLQNLIDYDIGLSLIPPENIYIESSPTKTLEYASKGLAIIVNEEIPFNANFVSESNSGLICQFNVESIAETILKLTKSQELNYYKKNARDYVEQHYLYERYVAAIIN